MCDVSQACASVSEKALANTALFTSASKLMTDITSLQEDTARIQDDQAALQANPAAVQFGTFIASSHRTVQQAILTSLYQANQVSWIVKCCNTNLAV